MGRLVTFTIVLFFLFNLSNSFRLSGQSLSLGKAGVESDTLQARFFLENEKSLTAAGEYQSALEAVQKAKELYAKNELWEDAIRCVIRSAEISDYLDEPKLKVKNANLALDLSRRYLSEDNLVQALSLRQKAESEAMQGALDSSNYFLKQAIPIFEKHNYWTEVGWCETILGINFLNQSQLDSCQKHLNLAEQLLKKKELPIGDKLDIKATLLNLFGVLYQLQGDYDKAINNTKEALLLDLGKHELSAIDSFYVVQHYKNLGALHLFKGDFQRALDYFMQAIYNSNSSSKDPILLNNIGELLQRQQKYKEAINYFQQSLRYTEKEANQIKAQANSCHGLLAAYRDLEMYDSAFFYFQQAIGLPDDSRKYMALGAMGNIFIKKKEPRQALEYLNNSVNEYANNATILNQTSFVDSRLYRLIADAYVLIKDENEALRFYQKALIVNHSNFNDSLDFMVNPSLSGIYEPNYFLEAIWGKAKTLSTFAGELKQLEKSFSTYQLAIQWVDSLQVSFSSESSHLDWSGKYKQIYEEAIGVAFRLYETTQDNKYINDAFSISEKSKNAILLEALKANEGKSYAGVPDNLIQKEKDLNVDIAFYQKALRKAKEKKESNKIKLYQIYLSQSRLELVTLKEKLEQNYPKFYALKYGGETISAKKIQEKLINNHSAFLEFFIGDSTAYIFVITKQSIDMLPLVSPEEIRQATASYRKTLLDIGAYFHNEKSAYENYHILGSYLYAITLQPAIENLSTDIKQLIFVPDEYLNAIPFEALIDNTDVPSDFDFSQLPYLLNKYEISYAYSANLLMKNNLRHEQLQANSECLAFAPPYKGSGQIAQRGSLNKLRGSAVQLKGTANEIQNIASYFKGQFDFSPTATEARFKKLANQFGILHLAMHGVPDFDNSNFNHLIFSDLNSDTIEDNLLHHFEIANMDLSAQLVVLSACETGVGKYEKGEGVYSLARSFMYAGVPSVVMSLWKVDDTSTSKLMPYFYENLANGNSKSKALYNAKKRFLKESNSKFSHPYYWSAFVVLGNENPIKKENDYLMWWGVGLILFGGLGWWFWKRK